MSFVVVWDTCTRPAYYADLHRVLAMPSGYVVRYDYRRKLFDEGSLRLFDDLESATKSGQASTAAFNALICYGEVENYDREAKNPGDGNTDNDREAELVVNIVPYRVAKVLSCRRFDKGSNNAEDDKLVYDLQLGAYPDLDHCARLLSHLRGNRERPHKSWHTLVNDDALFIFPGPEPESQTDRWEAVASALRRLQFKSDSFWRVSGTIGELAEPIRNRIKLRTAASGLTDCTVSLTDTEEVVLEIQNREPTVSPGSNASLGGVRTIEIETTTCIPADSKSIELRPYSVSHLRFRARASSFLQSDMGEVRLLTDTLAKLPRATEFPLGPALHLKVEVSRRLKPIVVGTACGILGIVGATLATKIQIYEARTGSVDYWSTAVVAVLALVSAACFVASAVLLRREVSFKQ